MRVSIEIVPREVEHLISELELIRTNFPSINTVNIPDLLRLDVRSWVGASHTKPYYEQCIPHIRAIDFNVKERLQLVDYLNEHRISEVLVVTGDAPQDIKRAIYPTTSVDLIQKLKAECPQLKVYAAIDPYRYNMRQELEYVKRKAEAGADGFFTQPFFDLRWMEMFAELLEGHNVYWGVSPVVSHRSQLYWETKNNAFFPKDFTPTLEWNVQFARRALDFVKSTNSNIYFMPIKIDLRAYLQGIFGA